MDTTNIYEYIRPVVRFRCVVIGAGRSGGEGGWLFQHGVVAFLGFRRRDVADGLQQAAIIEPVDPFQRRELDRLEAPRSIITGGIIIIQRPTFSTYPAGVSASNASGPNMCVLVSFGTSFGKADFGGLVLRFIVVWRHGHGRTCFDTRRQRAQLLDCPAC
jgi:hypothetical protein